MLLNAKKIIVLAALLSLCGTVRASDTLSVKLYFRQDFSVFDFDYRDNGKRLAAFADELNEYLANPANRAENLYLHASASPEGPSTRNEYLSQRRAKVLTRYITDNTTLKASQIRIDPESVNWSGLEAVLETMDQEWVPGALDIVRNTPIWVKTDGVVTGSRKKSLMDYCGGVPWKWMLENIYPDLRLAEFTITFHAPKMSQHRDTVYVSRVDTLYIREDHYYHPEPAPVIAAAPAPVPEQEQVAAVAASPEEYSEFLRKPVLELRTNLLVPLLNVGVEVPIGNRMTIGCDFYSPWLSRSFDKSHKSCFQLQFITPEVRYWFGRDHAKGYANWNNRFLGHSVALFGVLGQYDIGFDWTGRQGEIFAGGLDYIYAIPLGKGGIHMQFELGVGYMYTPTRKYRVYTDGGKLFETQDSPESIQFIGPLKAAVSLAVPIYANRRRPSDNNEEGGR